MRKNCYSNRVLNVRYIYLSLGAEASLERARNDKIKISSNLKGELTVATENQLSTISESLQLNTDINVKTLLESLAVTIKSGSISLQAGEMKGNQITLLMAITSDDILPDDEYIDESVTLTLKFVITLKNKNINPDFEWQSVTVGAGILVVVVAIAMSTLAVATGGAVLVALSLLISKGQHLFKD